MVTESFGEGNMAIYFTQYCDSQAIISGGIPCSTIQPVMLFNKLWFLIGDGDETYINGDFVTEVVTV